MVAALEGEGLAVPGSCGALASDKGKLSASSLFRLLTVAPGDSIAENAIREVYT